MSNRLKLIIGILIFVAVAGAAISASVLAERVPMNPAETVGNHPGNLLNGGYFCEVGDKVYFSHFGDSHTLYSMNPDETKVRRLGSMGVSQISGYGRFLYFYMDSSQYSHGKGLGYVGNTDGVYRYALRNGRTVSMERGAILNMQLCGSYLYFDGITLDGSGLYKLKIDGKERKRLSDQQINPSGFDGRFLYFTDTQDPSLKYFNTAVGDSVSRVYEGNYSQPIPTRDHIYYIDNAQDYHICRFNRTTGASEMIGTERVDFYNTDGRYVWYSVSAEGTPALKRMNADGSNVQVIMEGVFNGINFTSRYLYFAPFVSNGSAETMYHVPIDSIGPVSPFSPATK